MRAEARAKARARSPPDERRRVAVVPGAVRVRLKVRPDEEPGGVEAKAAREPELAASVAANEERERAANAGDGEARPACAPSPARPGGAGSNRWLKYRRARSLLAASGS